MVQIFPHTDSNISMCCYHVYRNMITAIKCMYVMIVQQGAHFNNMDNIDSGMEK